MADEKKFVNLAALDHYDNKIKALIDEKDTVTLKSAKDYADGLAGNYDAAGSAATAETNAKSYTDGKVAELNTTIAGVKTTAEQGVANAATAQAAADAADAKAQGAQTAVDTLAGKVGTVPEDKTVMGIIEQIQANAYDDTELRGLISDNADAIAAEKSRAEGIEGGLRSDIDAVSAKVTTLVGDDADKSVRTIANEELAKQLIADGAAESLDTLQEIAAWIQAHPGDAAAMNKAIDDLEALVGALPEGVTATTVVGYIAEAVAAEKTRAEGAEAEIAGDIAELQAKFGEGEGSVADMIADAVAAEKGEREAADNTLQAAVDAKAAQTDHEALAQRVTTAEGEIDQLQTDVAAKAAQSDLDTAVGRISTAEGKITTLEGASHTHSNKTELDNITAALIANWNDAYVKAHEHANKDVLDGITSIKVAAWDDAEANAKAHAESLIAEFTPVTTAEVDALFA